MDFVKHSVIPEGSFAGLPKAAVEIRSLRNLYRLHFMFQDLQKLT